MSFLSGVRETTKALGDLVEVGSAAADEMERLAAVNVPGPTLLDSTGRRVTGPLSKRSPLAPEPFDPRPGGGLSPTSPGYNTGEGTGGPFYSGVPPYQRPQGPFAGFGAGRGGYKLPPDPDKTQLVSYDGTLTVTLGYVIRCLQAGTCRRVRIPIPGVTIPVEMFDLTLALGDARAIFPTAQLNKGSNKVNPAGGGKGAEGGGGGGGGQGFRPFGGPSAPLYPPGSPSNPLPTSGPGKLQVAPPTEPTPGERAIVQAIREEFGKTRQQARSDGGTALRAQGLG